MKSDPSLEREMIEFMKAQIATKDQQINDLSGQLKGINDLNIKLVGQNVHQAEHIQDLLKLSSAPAEASPVVAKAGNQTESFVNQVDNEAADFVPQVDTKNSQHSVSSHEPRSTFDSEPGSRHAAQSRAPMHNMPG